MMQVEMVDRKMTVTVTPKFLLDQFKSGRFGIYEVQYLCEMMFQLGLGRIRKKKASNIDTLFFGDDVDLVQSVNMCLDLLKTAGLSLKGLSRFRQYARTNSGIEFNGERAVGTKFTYRRHMCLEMIEDFESTKPLFDRAVAHGKAFCRQHFKDPNYYERSIYEYTVMRIGLLVLAAEANPEFTMTARYDITN